MQTEQFEQEQHRQERDVFLLEAIGWKWYRLHSGRFINYEPIYNRFLANADVFQRVTLSGYYLPDEPADGTENIIIYPDWNIPLDLSSREAACYREDLRKHLRGLGFEITEYERDKIVCIHIQRLEPRYYDIRSHIGDTEEAFLQSAFQALKVLEQATAAEEGEDSRTP